MHAVVRNYSGAGAKELADLLEERKPEIETLIGSVTGLVMYSFVRSDGGCFTVTICQDKTGTDQSIQIARDWIQENAADLSVNPPAISEGSVILQVT